MRLLVIEDDFRLNASLVRDLIEEGYRVDAALDGEEGLYKAQSWPFDCILLDVMMPGMNGWEVLRRLRLKHKTPVIMLTARDSVNDRVQGLDLGADDYLPKPFDFIELLARLRSVIRRSAGHTASIIKAGDVTLDFDARQVTHKGQPVDLRAREYTLVEALMLRQGRIVSPLTLQDISGDGEEETNSNALEVHICNIRKKLGKGFIKTVRGLGYTISQDNR